MSTDPTMNTPTGTSTMTATEWIELAGVRFPVRLTKTRIVVQMAVGYRERYGAWRECPNVEGYFDLAEPRAEHKPEMRARFVSEYSPVSGLYAHALALDLANPASWPPCSDGVRAALEARAQRGREIIAERERRDAARRLTDARWGAIRNAERAILLAARAGDDAALLTAAAELRKACA